VAGKHKSMNHRMCSCALCKTSPSLDVRWFMAQSSFVTSAWQLPPLRHQKKQV
jgi:hypothetical protein